MPPNKFQYRNYKQFEANLLLPDAEKLLEKASCTEW